MVNQTREYQLTLRSLHHIASYVKTFHLYIIPSTNIALNIQLNPTLDLSQIFQNNSNINYPYINQHHILNIKLKNSNHQPKTIDYEITT
jgi:hypothetical protein